MTVEEHSREVPAADGDDDLKLRVISLLGDQSF